MKVDEFDNMILRYPEPIRTMLRDLDTRVREFSQKSRQPISIQRYTTDVPDIRYRIRVNDRYKPVFLRVRPRQDKVRLEIETVHDPLKRTEPREKTGKWKVSPRSDRERILTRMLDSVDEDLLFKSMLSSMTGHDIRT